MSTKPQVQINTSYGPFIMELYPEQAPKTVNNFLSYVDKDFYTGTIFHRVINQFVVQGGGMNQKLQFKNWLISRLTDQQLFLLGVIQAQ